MTESMILSRGTVRDSLSACEQLEADLSAFVDGELSKLDYERVAGHVESCGGCRAFVHSLAGMGALQRRREFDIDAERFLAHLDSADIWKDLTVRLLTDARSRLAAVLYELGKALIVTGLNTSPTVTEVPILVKKPGSIPVLSRKGQRLAREYKNLRTEYAAGRQKEPEVRARGLFPRNEAVRSTPAFESGRVCLEECLKLDPDRHEARIYLAHYFGTVGRFDRARQQVRILLRKSPPRKIRIHAVHVLGRIYSAARQFVKASEMEQKVLEAATHDNDHLMQAGALTNLAVYAFKLGRFDEVEASLDRLVRDFSSRLEDMVLPVLRKSREIRLILQRNRAVLGRMRDRYPMLFAS